MSEGWAVSRPASTINKNASSPTPTLLDAATTAAAPAATGWNVTRPSAAPVFDDDDFFGVRSRTVKAAGILKDLKEESSAAGMGGAAPRSSRPSLEVR
jgi:hypothetical protein